MKQSIRKLDKKGDLREFEHDMVVAAQNLIYWEFPTQQSLEFTENGLKKRKCPVSHCSLVKRPS